MMMKKAERNPAMEGLEWEMRPSGMFVQKRTDSSYHHSNFSTIKIRVKFNSSLHEIQINPRSSFGELKKMIEGLTGVDPQDQKLMFKEKERDSNQFLNILGVKHGSILVLSEDLKSRETTFVAMKSVAEVTMEVDNLATKGRKLERLTAKGGTVTEKELLNLSEMFMSLIIKLDEIVADGDVKQQRKTQVKRVQRYIERLDKLKAQNEEATQQGKKSPRLPQQQMAVGGQVPHFTNFATHRATFTPKLGSFDTKTLSQV